MSSGYHHQAPPTSQRISYIASGLFLLTFTGLLLAFAFGQQFFTPAPALSGPAPLSPAQSDRPNYSKLNAWAALPFRDDFADLAPLSDGMTPKSAQEADVFFVHTTTAHEAAFGNIPLTDRGAAERADQLSIKHQASAFAECCRVYAPRYRQAAQPDSGPDGRRALDIAYQDVVDAFDHFLRRWNRERPFILAGHGQGSRHILRLLEEKIAGTGLESRLVAAYAVGLGIPLSHVAETIPSVEICASPTQTGCLLGWTTLAEGHPDDRYATQSILHPSGVYRANANRPRLCVNPLSWLADEGPVMAIENPGSLPFTPGLAPLDSPQPRLTGARCDHGTLRVQPDRLDEYERGAKGDYHLYDYNLFYASVQQNAVRRVEAFQGR